MAWSDWIDAAGSVWDWFEGSDTAQDLVGAGLQAWLYDQPELDYDKLMEMAIKQATIDSPDQFTPTMTSQWTVDPETGKREQNLQYRPEFQSLLDMLVQRAGSPKETYRAPEGMTTDLLGSRMNHLLGQSGLDAVDHQRFQFPEYAYADFSGMGSGGTPNTGTPGTTNPHTPPPGANDNEEEQTPVGGGFENQGDGFNQDGDGFAGMFGPSYDEWMVRNDLINRGPNANDFGSGPAPDQGSFTDWLDNNIGTNWRNGTPFESWVIENSDDLGKWAGRIIGAATDLPAGGKIGEWVAGLLEEAYFRANPNLALSNPADPGTIPPDGMDELIAALNQITNETAGVDGTEQSSPIPTPAAPRPPVGQGQTYGNQGIGTGTWSGVSPGGSTYGGTGGLTTYNRGNAIRRAKQVKKAKEWAEEK